MATLAKSDRTTIVTLASAIAGPFDLTFRLFDDDALAVYVNDIPREDFAISSSYTNGYDDNASITFDAALASGDVIRIHGDLTPGRSDNYQNGPGLTEKLNIEMGRLWSSISDIKRDANRSLKTFQSVSPLAIEANQIIAANSTADGFVFGPTVDEIIDYGATASLAAINASASATFAENSAVQSNSARDAAQTFRDAAQIFRDASSGARDQSVAARAGAETAQAEAEAAAALSQSLASGAPKYTSRPAFVSAVSAGNLNGLPDGAVVDVVQNDALLKYRKAVGSAVLSDIPGWVPQAMGDRVIHPQHFKANVSPGVTPMADAIQSALAFLSKVSATAATSQEVISAGPCGTLDYLGETVLGEKPVVIGRVGSLFSGWFSHLRIANGRHLCSETGAWESLDVDIPGFAFVISDHLAGNIDGANFRLRNIHFDKSFVLDCNYVTGGRWWENTSETLIQGTVAHVGVRRTGDLTSIGSPSRNPRGVGTKNGHFTIDGALYQSSATYEGRQGPFAAAGVCTLQARPSAGSVPLDGTEVVGGKWVSPTGGSARLEIRINFPLFDAGKIITVTGFADFAETQPLSETFPLRRNSTAFQRTYTPSRFAVVTGISLAEGLGGSIAISGSLENNAVRIYTADAIMNNVNIASGHNVGLLIGSSGSVQSNGLHIWAREMVIEADALYSSSFENSFFDFTDVRLYSHHHHIGSSLMTAGDCRIIPVAVTPDTTMESLTLGPFTGTPGRTDPFVEFETQGAGTFVAPEFREHSILPYIHSRGQVVGKGRYRKYSDGTMKCWILMELGSIAALGSGTTDSPFHTIPQDWDFAEIFSTFPLQVRITPLATATNNDSRNVTISYGAASASQLSLITAYRVGNETVGTVIKAHVEAEGRWD